MSNKYKGTVIHIGFTEQVTDKFAKRIIVVSDKSEKYPQEICFEFINDNTDQLDNFTVGSLVEIEFNLRGKLFKDKWYNTLNGWKITNVQVSTGNAPHENLDEYKDKGEQKSAFDNNGSNPSDDLPF